MDDRPRLILLGASNLAMGLPRAVAAARAAAAGPVEVLAAPGHGRSYGVPSRVLVRTLPGIVPCGLWAALAASRDGRRTVAVVTDVGNDVAYGLEPVRIADLVGVCLDRLEAAGARCVLTRLPVPALRRLGRARFDLLRSLIFPGSTLTYEDAVVGATTVDRLLARIALDRSSVRLIALPSGWYGADAIHFRRPRAAAAWAAMIGAAFGTELPAGAARAGLGDRLRFVLARPERRHFPGRTATAPQPAIRLRDGSRIGLY